MAYQRNRTRNTLGGPGVRDQGPHQFQLQSFLPRRRASQLLATKLGDIPGVTY